MSEQPQTHYLATDDGWQLALHVWVARGRDRKRPLLMVHGLAANRLHLDFDERYSLARMARDRGFSAYVIELRGAGLSRAPDGRDRTRYQWGFEDFATRDIPAAVQGVLEHSGSASLHILGHSMGGMLSYRLGTERPPYLRSIVTLGSPLVEELALRRRETRLLGLATRLVARDVLRRVPLRRLGNTAGRFVPLSARVIDNMLINRTNTEPQVIARMAREAIDDIPLQLVAELTHQMRGGENVTNPYAYEASLGRIDVPVLALAGVVDRVAPLESVRAAVERLRTGDIRYREFGQRFGDTADYGHVDLLVGRRAPEEVYPAVLDFWEDVD